MIKVLAKYPTQVASRGCVEGLKYTYPTITSKLWLCNFLKGLWALNQAYIGNEKGWITYAEVVGEGGASNGLVILLKAVEATRAAALLGPCVRLERVQETLQTLLHENSSTRAITIGQIWYRRSQLQKFEYEIICLIFCSMCIKLSHAPIPYGLRRLPIRCLFILSTVIIYGPEWLGLGAFRVEGGGCTPCYAWEQYSEFRAALRGLSIL